MNNTIVICSTVVVLAVIFVCYKLFSRPYTEEIISHRGISDENGNRYAHVYHIKRTYSDGTVKYVKKKFTN